ncbi:DUF4258 domain-containing protein [Ensifer adhaerens]|uniref:DUF4258 domain-containing protein n=1 Tax=Ensifer adhaerens TaxID=106592 RepID=UPI001CBFD73F|nr:DUF4258 domain-containing protein [Ensifer adhaerens]MBZ7924407.1 DUF4258 domain-containing protein [Ensifer adhaerens]UAX96347.1 DUF4258 domain-containing protein [Ensifer adhaerens]UAY04310.1 DUF4258 domain-containing protein [Ensifer adhaerens]UAY12296.1 DUF4258 domain-containing protein [Ensifer adhaerens]
MSNVVDFGARESEQPKKMSRGEFQKLVRDFTINGKVQYTRHAKQDHPERKITTTMIRNCLLKGTVIIDPIIDIKGNWKADVHRHGAGQELTVPVAIIWEKHVLVISAM